MTAHCVRPLGWDELVQYAANDLSSDELDRVEEHLLSCGACTSAAERVVSITNAIAALPPPIITADQLRALRARGLRVVENPVRPSDRHGSP